MHLVVTVPKWFWPEWIAEGDTADDTQGRDGSPSRPPSGEEWGYSVSSRPNIAPGERLYIAAHGLLRGYAPVTRVCYADGRWHICRRAGAVAVTIDQPIPGFRGFRKIWWDPADEKPFPDWKTKGVIL